MIIIIFLYMNPSQSLFVSILGFRLWSIQIYNTTYLCQSFMYIHKVYADTKWLCIHEQYGT